ncbi:MAG: CoA pyrophosphatase [Candidatus Latescibacterota bacterium]|nr:CoA pyrophosphatase [Candidatus Latescibacterota bacterium]
MPDLSTAREALSNHAPRLVTGNPYPQAAVAAIFHDQPEDARLLFIERARCDNDPWSGDLAFPGGRVEAQDGSVHDTAERETREEIGWSLEEVDRLGRLDDVAGSVLPITVSACVYATRIEQSPTLSAEVVDVFWTPVADLLDPERRTVHTLRRRGAERTFPALDVLGPGCPLLWGVTYRFVCDLMQFFGHDLPT